MSPTKGAPASARPTNLCACAVASTASRLPGPKRNRSRVPLKLSTRRTAPPLASMVSISVTPCWGRDTRKASWPFVLQAGESPLQSGPAVHGSGTATAPPTRSRIMSKAGASLSLPSSDVSIEAMWWPSGAMATLLKSWSPGAASAGRGTAINTASRKCERIRDPSMRRRRISVEKHRLALTAPADLVASRQRLQIGRRRRRIVHPTTQQIAAVDHVDRGPALFILVGKVAPNLVIRPQPPESLEREREQSPRPERFVVIVHGVFHRHLDACAELAYVLMKRRLEPAGPEPAATHPWRCKRMHLCQQCRHVQIRRPEQLQRPGGAATFRQFGGFEHPRAGIAAPHQELGSFGPGVAPRPPAERPAISRCSVRLPTLHRHDMAVDVEIKSPDEPPCKLPESQTVPHRHRAGADKAFATRLEHQPFHGPAHGIRAIQNPHGLVLLRSRFEHVTQCGDERVDSAPDVL